VFFVRILGVQTPF